MDPIFESYKQIVEVGRDVTKMQYQDTARGAEKAFYDLAMMNDEMDPKIYDEYYKGQKAIADPAIEGVWMFKNKKHGHEVVILYLKGFRDSYGKIRDENWIEVGSM